MKYNLLAFLFVLLFLISFSSAKQVSSISNGLMINTWPIDFLLPETNYTFLWDLSQNGLLINANLTSCSFFGRRAGGPVPGTFVKSNGTITSDGAGYYFFADGKNFTVWGQYDYQIDCYLKSNNSISGNYLGSFIVGVNVSLEQTFIYIFFLLICLSLVYVSFLAIIKNPYSEDKLTGQGKYNIMKKNRFVFYMQLLKKKFWILGVFGLYLSIFLFSSILNLVAYNMQLSELNLILITFNNVMAWFSIPFVIFWFIYIGLYIFNEGVEILKYDFGGIRNER